MTGRPEPASRRVARWISGLGHPFVLIIGFVIGGSLSAMGGRQALTLTVLIVACGIGPIVLYLLRLVRQGRTKFDVSARELRGPIYALGLLLGAVLIVAARVMKAPAGVVVTMAYALALVMIAALINLRLKVSLHTAFAVWVSLGWLVIEPRLGYGLMVLAVGVAWSRIHLRRHSPAEVLCGAALGTLIALAMLATLTRIAAAP